MLHIWHLFTTASCLFLCLTCPYLVTECKNHHDEQLNVEQAEVQTNYDNPQHKKFSLTDTEKIILSSQAELLTKQIVIFTLDEAPTSTNFSPYPDDAGIAGFLESILVFDEYPNYPYLNTYRIEEDGTCYFKKEIVKQIIKEVFNQDSWSCSSNFCEENNEYSISTGRGIGKNLDCKNMKSKFQKNDSEILVSFELWASPYYPNVSKIGDCQSSFSVECREDGSYYLQYIKTEEITPVK